MTRELEIKTAMRYDYAPIKLLKITRLTIPPVGDDVGQLLLS